MTTMLSLILAIMLSIGGSPAASANPACCPGDTGIQAPIDNNRPINRFFEDYNQKTASRADLKKILETPLIKHPKTHISLRFSLYIKEELRLMGYMDSFNLYEAFNNNPLTYIDPYGTSSKKDGINPLVARSAYSRIFKYYRSQGMDRDQASAKAMKDLVDLGYIEDKYELKLGTAVTTHTGFFYTAMHYVVLPVFEMSPAGILKDAMSLPFGKDLVYGTKLKWWNYAMVAVPILYETFKIGRGLGLADEFLDLGDYLPKISKRGPIFADTNLLVNAAEKGNIAALKEIKAGQTLITPSQYKEFLNVTTGAQRKARIAFLQREGIELFSGPKVRNIVESAEFRSIFNIVKKSQGRGDAALTAFSKVTGIELVTGERRLFNFLSYTYRKLGVPIRRVR